VKRKRLFRTAELCLLAVVSFLAGFIVHASQDAERVDEVQRFAAAFKDGSVRQYDDYSTMLVYFGKPDTFSELQVQGRPVLDTAGREMRFAGYGTGSFGVHVYMSGTEMHSMLLFGVFDDRLPSPQMQWLCLDKARLEEFNDALDRIASP